LEVGELAEVLGDAGQVVEDRLDQPEGQQLPPHHQAEHDGGHAPGVRGTPQPEGAKLFPAQGQGGAGQGEDDDGRDEQVEHDGDGGQQHFHRGQGRPERSPAPSCACLVPVK